MQRIDPEKREEWEAMLEAPLESQAQPRGQRRPRPIAAASDAQIESEGAAFMSLMNMDIQGKATR